MNSIHQLEKVKEHINKDLAKTFIEIYEENKIADSHTKNIQLEQIKSRINRYVPKFVATKRLLLLDTLINYLIAEARQELEASESKTINAFYDSNDNWIDTIKAKFNTQIEEKSISFSSDLRLIYSLFSILIATPLIFFLGGEIFDLKYFILVPVLITLSLTIAKFVYSQTESFVLQKMNEDIEQYLENSRNKIQKELEEAIEIYQDEFEKFLTENKKV